MNSITIEKLLIDSLVMLVIVVCGMEALIARTVPWQARHELTSEQYQATFDELVGQGYRLIHVSGYSVNNQDRYAAIWEKSSGPAWEARHGLTSAQYQATFDELVGQGYRLIHVSGYSINNQELYAAIWEKAQGSGSAWAAHHGLTSAQYQTTFDELVSQGYRLVHVSGYSVNNQDRYAAIWEKSSGSAWQTRHRVTSAQYQMAFDELVSQGHKLAVVSGYSLGGQDYYAAIWDKLDAVEPTDPPPATGVAVSELLVFDRVMQEYMSDRHIKAGTLAIMKEGVVVFERGYGWLDEEMTTLIPPDSLLRLASIVKPITAAAIKKLVSEGRLDTEDKIFCLTDSTSSCILNISPFSALDQNVKNITIQHVLDHKAGWNRETSGDPMFQSIELANQLGIPSPPDKRDIARYMLGKPLDHNPGITYAYSNFGYMLLGLVIEEVTGFSYANYIQKAIFDPLCIASTEVELGRSLITNRNSREPWYSDPGAGLNVFTPSELVSWPNGGFYLESMDAHGGLIASSRAVAGFLDAYWIDGDPRNKNGENWTHFGSLPGTHTLARQRSDGINIVALFNQRTDSSGLDYFQIQTLLDNAADSVSQWPTYLDDFEPSACK